MGLANDLCGFAAVSVLLLRRVQAMATTVRLISGAFIGRFREGTRVIEVEEAARAQVGDMTSDIFVVGSGGDLLGPTDAIPSGDVQVAFTALPKSRRKKTVEDHDVDRKHSRTYGRGILADDVIFTHSGSALVIEPVPESPVEALNSAGRIIGGASLELVDAGGNVVGKDDYAEGCLEVRFRFESPFVLPRGRVLW